MVLCIKAPIKIKLPGQEGTCMHEQHLLARVQGRRKELQTGEAQWSLMIYKW